MSRVTMKDIAVRMGVSVNTVHKAITGKPGVSDEMRSGILLLADELGYRRNVNASSLSRKDARILICLPDAEVGGRLYYASYWEGCRRQIGEVPDIGAVFEEIRYRLGSYVPALQGIVCRIERGEKVDGILACAPMQLEEERLLRRIVDLGTTLILIDGDRPQTGRACAVVPDYDMAGELMAEQAMNLLCDIASPHLILLTGDFESDAHASTTRAFHALLAERRSDVTVEDLRGAHRCVCELRDTLSDRLRSGGVDMVCSVFAVGTEVMSNVLENNGLTGKIRAIGNDIFPESIAALRDGVVNNLVYKDPAGLAAHALKLLLDCVLLGAVPRDDVELGRVDLVFRSNLDRYI